jgi:hypothetical protein
MPSPPAQPRGGWVVVHYYSTGDTAYLWGPFDSSEEAQDYAARMDATSQGTWQAWRLWKPVT